MFLKNGSMIDQGPLAGSYFTGKKIKAVSAKRKPGNFSISFS